MNKKVEKIKKIVEKELSCSAHNMDHIMRVYNLCLHLAEGEDVDLEVLELAALLHDIARGRENEDIERKIDHAILGAEMAEKILKDFGLGEEKIKHIKDCILSHRYRNKIEPKTLEAKILFDADKLDSLGAVGAARAIIWAGQYNAYLYKEVEDLEEYAKNNLSGDINGRIQDKTQHSPQIEFAVKLQYVKDKLYTKKAKEVGEERTKYLREFFERMRKEINGEI